MPLRKADLTATKKFEDGDAWMILRVGGLTKGEADTIADASTAVEIHPAVAAAATAGDPQAARAEIVARTAAAKQMQFTILCESWSLGEVSARAYAELDAESGAWVDDCIEAVLKERRERAEKNVRSSPKPRGRATSSAKAEG